MTRQKFVSSIKIEKMPAHTEALERRTLLSGAISGIVFNDANHNGVQDSGEKGIAGITVYQDPNYNHKIDSTEQHVFTDANGAFVFSNPPADPEILRIILPSGATQTFPANGIGQFVGRNTGKPLTGVNFGITFAPTTGSISGQVFNDLNSDGIDNDGGGGVGNVQVYVDLKNTGSFAAGDPTANTDVLGDYTIANVAPGSYAVRIVVPAGDEQSFPPALNQGDSVTVQAGKAAFGADFGLITSKFPIQEDITGTVFNDLNHDGVQDNGETGIAGVTVYQDPNYNHKLEASEQSTITDANGNFDFNDPPADPEILRIILPSGATQTFPANGIGQYVGKNTGQTIAGVNFGIYNPSTGIGGSLSGNVDDANGKGVAGVVVYEDPNYNHKLDANEQSTITDANGIFLFTNLPADPEILRIITPAGTQQLAPTGGAGQYVGKNTGATITGLNFEVSSAPPPTVEAPYLTAFTVGQTIPAAEYDKGGEGIAYHDTTAANQGGDPFRNGDGVDIQVGGATGNIVGNAVAGEWLQYTLNVAAAGSYVLSAMVANTAAGGMFHAAVGGANLTGALFIPATGSWTTYTTIESTAFNLPAGNVVLRIALDHTASSGGVGNFDSFAILPAQATLQANLSNILKSGNAAAVSGAYMHATDGATIADVNSTQIYEPASGIKTLAAVTALQAVQAGTASLSETVTYYYDPSDPTNLTPNPDAYPHTPANAVNISLQNAIAGMLQNSDNRMTYAVEQRFGLPAFNATAQQLGMTHTTWTQTVGNMIPGNFMTLADADLLYDKVLDGSVLNPTYATLFQNLMLNQTNFGLSRYLPVIHQEAASVLGVAVGSAAEISLTNTFAANVFWGSKAGTYYLPIDSQTIDDVRSHTGYLILPSKVNGAITYQDYSYGIFMNNAIVPASNNTAALNQVENAILAASQEMARSVIHDALVTFV
jgi:beta-lactamase class A